jgi:hypothetical protein
MKNKSRSKVKTPKIIDFPDTPTVYKADLDGLNAPPANLKTSGIKVRGTGAATKGLLARGPMA